MNDKLKQQALPVLLIISLLLNLGLFVALFYQEIPENRNIIGTFCTGTGMSQDDEYLVFQQDGVYVRYKQFEELEEGAYTLRDPGVYALTPKDGAPAQSVLYRDGEESLWLVLSGTEIVKFDKISQTPTFLNLPDRSAPPEGELPPAEVQK